MYILIARHNIKTLETWQNENDEDVEIVSGKRIYQSESMRNIERIKEIAANDGWFDFEVVNFVDDGKFINFADTVRK